MSTLLQRVSGLLRRFRFPVSLPEEVLIALGIELSIGELSFMSFEDLMALITKPGLTSSTLKRYMERSMAESLFQSAVKKEIFRFESHFSYYFSGGWLEFALHFDEESRLRRVYVQHRCLMTPKQIEINLKP